jgi:hypothetical protein
MRRRREEVGVMLPIGMRVVTKSITGGGRQEAMQGGTQIVLHFGWGMRCDRWTETKPFPNQDVEETDQPLAVLVRYMYKYISFLLR